MGIEYYLVKDAARETYDLGKFTADWAPLLAAPGMELAAREGGLFLVFQSVDVVAELLAQNWADMSIALSRSDYLRLVATDICRWAGDSWVRFTSDASFDGWKQPDGSLDPHATGSRYPEDHPEWPTRKTPGDGEP